MSVALCTLPSVEADVAENDLLFKNGFLDSNAILFRFSFIKDSLKFKFNQKKIRLAYC